jgi:6,7-dimethyl-8-ribityllumazine synthase
MSAHSLNLLDTSGILLPKDACVVIIRTEWNDHINGALEEGCKRILKEHQIKYKTLMVPGAIEIPFCIKRYWDKCCLHSLTDRPHAFIALGCVLRGDTPHFEYVCQAVTTGIVQLNLQLPIPTIFGVLTVNDEQQALERTGGRHGHKGEEAAITALKMMSLDL